MELFDKTMEKQRALSQTLASLPMQDFIAEALKNLNKSAGHWEGRVRPLNDSGAPIVNSKKLPEELAEFYRFCDGFEAVQGEFPASIYRLSELRLGADYTPSLSERLFSHWNAYGNDSDKPAHLSIFPPDNLLALATNNAQCYLKPSLVDAALSILPPAQDGFVVILLEDSGPHLSYGTVLEIEGGIATQHKNFKTWLSDRASLFGFLDSLHSSIRT